MKFWISHGQAIRSVFGRSRVTHFMLVLLSLVEGQAGERGGADERRLGDLEPFLQQRKRHNHDRGAGDRAGRGGGGALDESLQARVALEAAEEPARNNDEQVRGGEEGD